MNWDDPVARAQLIEQVGPDEYSRRQAEHFVNTTLATHNGYSIRSVHSPRFGRIFMVDGLGKGASTLEGAKELAAAAPRRETP